VSVERDEVGAVDPLPRVHPLRQHLSTPGSTGAEAARARLTARREARETASVSRSHTDRSPVALLRAALDGSVDQLLEQVELACSSDDPEAVHRGRVATRRLRSDLHTFGPVLDVDVANELRVRLRGVGELLGAVRDDDVLLERLRARAQELPETDGPAFGRLLSGLGRERAAARAALVEGLAGASFHDLVADLRAVGAGARDGTGVGARRLARRPWKRLRRAVRALPEVPTDDALHDVRKKTKHARYAVEAIEPLVRGPGRRLAHRLRDLQDTLGSHHDAVVAVAWLRSARDASDDAEVAFAAGELARAFTADAERARHDWPHAWKRARRAAGSVF
jgi:CHAD domain-containing protein